MKAFYYLIIFTLFVVSCTKNKLEDSVNENDSTVIAESLNDSEVEHISLLINELSVCLDSIQIQENLIFSQKESETSKDRMLMQLRAYKELLAKKRDKINSLMAENKNISASSKKTIQNLEKVINFLNSQLEQKDKQISELEQLVENGNTTISSLRYSLKEKNDEGEYLQEQNYNQDKALHTAYYIVASKKDLKAKGLLKSNLFTKKVNNESIDKSLFKKIDVRSFKLLVIKSKSPKILSANPESSYSLTKNDDGTTTLNITNADKFWNVSHFLIIME